jgi:hypothetical protein
MAKEICPYCYRGLVKNQVKLARHIKYLEDTLIEYRIRNCPDIIKRLTEIKRLISENVFYEVKPKC